MKRSIHIEHNGRWLDNSYLLQVMVTKGTLVEWCLSLAMLYTGVVDLLVLVETGGSPYMEIRMDGHVSPHDRGSARMEVDVLHVTIGGYEVIYWMTYYLGYYRDGMVGANHIDCDLPLEPSNAGNHAYVVLEAADIAPPLSPEQARKLLEME